MVPGAFYYILRIILLYIPLLSRLLSFFILLISLCACLRWKIFTRLESSMHWPVCTVQLWELQLAVNNFALQVGPLKGPWEYLKNPRWFISVYTKYSTFKFICHSILSVALLIFNTCSFQFLLLFIVLYFFVIRIALFSIPAVGTSTAWFIQLSVVHSARIFLLSPSCAVLLVTFTLNDYLIIKPEISRSLEGTVYKLNLEVL